MKIINRILCSALILLSIISYANQSVLAKQSTFSLLAVPVPAPVSPSGTITDTTPTYRWGKIAGASQYRYQLLKGASVIYTITFAASACGSGVNCAHTPLTSLSNGTYAWRVRVMVSGTWSSYSPLKGFAYARVPVSRLPSGDITDTTPSYSWSKVVNATRYELRLYRGASMIYSPIILASSCTSGVNCGFTPVTKLKYGAYTWQIRAMLSGSWKAFSAPKAFYVSPVLVGAGDIASCSSTGDEATANLIDGIAGTVFTAGDNAYQTGTAAEFANCYDPSWGRFKARTKPSPGNHEYYTSGASGYYGYFGAAAGDPAKGYYSYDLGDWHIIVMNSEIDTAAGSPQEVWLRQDLAAHPVVCTLAYWHKPRFSSSASHGSNTAMQPLWQALYEYHADVVVNGHDHLYERFSPQTPDGTADPDGISEFVAGMGGASLYTFGNILPNSPARNNDPHGVLKFILNAASYRWQFVPVAGKTYADNGTANCVP